MDEIVVKVARTLACLTRLAILSRLVRQGETAPTQLVRGLSIRLDTLSVHLRRLADAGLIQRRRSGAWTYCSAESPYSEEAFSGKVTAWVRRLLQDPVAAAKDYGLGQVRNPSEREAESALHGAIFEAATAFGHLRRLQILRRLAHGGATTTERIMEELRMSDAAASRHLDKLARRGYVQVTRTGRSVTYALAGSSKTPLHAQLFEIVRATWSRN
jgi:DNA-binding transcriptional ArsR family regulator